MGSPQQMLRCMTMIHDSTDLKKAERENKEKGEERARTKERETETRETPAV